MVLQCMMKYTIVIYEGGVLNSTQQVGFSREFVRISSLQVITEKRKSKSTADETILPHPS